MYKILECLTINFKWYVLRNIYFAKKYQNKKFDINFDEYKIKYADKWIKKYLY